MSLIKQAHEISVQTKIKALVYGQAGMGKTTLAVSSPKPLLLDCDNGVHRINAQHRCPTVQVGSYAEILEVLTKEDLSVFESIVIDTGGKLLDLMASYIIDKNPKMGRANGTLTLQGYGERKAEFSAFCKLVARQNKHLLFVAHRETKTEGDATRYVPLFGGSNYDSLVTELDLVGYLEANGRRRVITFDGTDRNDGKNTCNLPTMIELPLVVDEQGNGLSNTFFQKNVIDPYLKNLEKGKELAIAFTSLMNEIDEYLILITDSQSLNEFCKKIDNFNHIGNSKALTAIKVKAIAEKLELTFNKEVKSYEKV